VTNEFGLLDDNAEVVVLGLGNLLQRDEGIGIRALERLLENYMFPETVRLVDGGTLGLDLVSYFEGVDRLLVLDAVLTKGPPGTLLRLSGDEVPAYFGMRTSPHQLGLSDMLAVTHLRGTEPREVVLIGLQPEKIELSWDLSDSVAEHMNELVEAAIDQLHCWGFAVEKI